MELKWCIEGASEKKRRMDYSIDTGTTIADWLRSVTVLFGTRERPNRICTQVHRQTSKQANEIRDKNNNETSN